MNIHLIAMGHRMPSWVEQGYKEYAKRIPPQLLHLHEIPLSKRNKASQLDKIIKQEGQRMLAAIPPASHVIALDVTGKSWSTEQLAEQLQSWQHDNQSISLLIGGPEGLSPTCQARAQQRWSLSSLTLPHPLVRIVLIEQLYRAWTLLSGHPYHKYTSMTNAIR